jgi:HlyD family secretion protein
MKNKRIIPVIIVLVVVVGVTVYFELVRYMGTQSKRIEGSGVIEVTEIEVASKIAGRIVSLPFDEGEEVKQGDLLAKLSYDELSAQKLSALANLTNAEKNLKRARELFTTGSISQREFDNAVAAYNVAKGNYDYVMATIDQAVLYAPISGVVLSRNLEVGELAFPGTSIMTLADLTRAWIKIYVNEKHIGLIKHGQKALVFVDSYPDKPFAGKVVAIAQKAEFTPKTIQTKEERVKLVFAVKIAIDNTDKKLKPGMPADAVILTGEQ